MTMFDVHHSVEHRCHALHCIVPVRPRMLMCKKHWWMVPAAMRRRVWLHYRPGQEIDKRPSQQYLDAAYAAIDDVARQEGIPHYGNTRQ